MDTNFNRILSPEPRVNLTSQPGHYSYTEQTGLFKTETDFPFVNKNSYQNCVVPYLIMWFNLRVILGR